MASVATQGGRALQQALTVTLDVPLMEGLTLDHEPVRKKTAAHVGKQIRAAMKAGRQMDGSAMGVGDDGGPAMRDTGRTIRDIKYDRRDQSVRPSTWPRSDLASRKRKHSTGIEVQNRRLTSSFGLYMVHLVGTVKRAGKTVSRVKLPDIGDPLGSVTYWPQHIGAVVEKALTEVRFAIKTRGTKRIRKGT